jgi:hypothetical protein
MGFSPNGIDRIKEDMRVALKSVEEKYGVLFQLGNVSYSDNEFTTKVQCFVNTNGTANPAQLEFNKLAPFFGLLISDYGKPFIVEGIVYRITGLKKANRKYPIIAETADGKSYKFSTELVLPRILR